MSKLEDYRQQIREIDQRVLALIKDRLNIGIKLSEIKRSMRLPIIDTDAEQATIDNLVRTSSEIGINISFARQLGELLIEKTIEVQNDQKPGPPAKSKDQILKEIIELTHTMLVSGNKIARFEIGEPNFPPPQPVIRELTTVFKKKKIIGYGAAVGLPELRKKLAVELSSEHHVGIDPDQVIITPGARFAIFATVMSFVSELERVVIPQPAFPAYEECVALTKGRVIPVATSLDNNWELNLSKIEAEMRKGARMIVLNSPNNPTGKVISKDKFHDIVELAHRHGTLVLSDEVYEKYVHSKAPSILDEEYTNSIYVNSFSKRFGLTGWRIAYLVTSKDYAKRIKRIIQTAVTCVPEFIQRAALIALRQGESDAERNRRSILRKVELTCKELSKIDVEFYRPDGAFYVFPRSNKPNFDSVKFATKLLKEQHVSVVPGQSFGDYPAFFRLAVSLPETQIPNAIRSIGKAVEQWS
ncbi:MAG TPA: aminotransferase class I/II-fold pyridoxal phosphate-dependent enzyme [Candidatus Bathyarchaeia archaeon]|nr:aminotransferase class I/II-fold pyridoxal phosphate-dependent enzyme [Candidatus Bathyarchaeia archaeon]